MKRRILVFVLTACMLLTMLPAAVLATDTEGAASTLPGGEYDSSTSTAYIFFKAENGSATARYFDSLDNAITVAANEEYTDSFYTEWANRVGLCKDVNITTDTQISNIRIDTRHAHLQVNSGTLTLTNVTLTHTPDNANRTNYSRALACAPNGTLIINGGNFSSAEPELLVVWGNATITGDASFTTTAKANTTNRWDGKPLVTVNGKDGDTACTAALTMESGTIDVSGTSEALGNALHGLAAFNGGTITLGKEGQTGGPTIKGNYVAIGGNNTLAPANITIYGGTYTTSALSGSTATKYDAALFASPKGTYTIKGGTFNATTGGHAISIPYQNTEVDMTISSGDFTGDIYMGQENGVESGSPELSVSGGTFSQAVETKYLSDEIYQVTGSDGTCSYFEDVNDALEAAGEDDVITQKNNEGEMEPIVVAVTLDKTELTLTVGGTQKLTATVTPEDATDPVEWSTSDVTVATVAEDGTVTAVKAGTATITATAGTQTATATVTVKEAPVVTVPVEKVALDSKDFALTVGETKTLKATVTPDNATDKTVTWTSSDEKVATVKDGKVTAVKAGTATITAKAGEKTAAVMVTVENTPVDVTKVFSDLGSRTQEDIKSINYVYNKGLMNGMVAPANGKPGEFGPTVTTSRAMVVTVLYRMAGEPTDFKYRGKFGDIQINGKDVWYTDAIKWAYANGITTGRDAAGTVFDPMGDVTRQEMVAFFARYAKNIDGLTLVSDGLNGYTDKADVSDYCKDFMGWSVKVGLIKGTSDTELSPHSKGERVQLALVLYRYCEQVFDKYPLT